MAIDRLPPGLAPSSGSLNLTEDTVPAALQQEHRLAPGRWGVLHVFEGSVRFVNLETGDERDVSAPDLIIIHPQVPHKLHLTGQLRCRVDFFRELDDNSTMRTPGGFADDEVYRSFQRCEAMGDFADTFYNAFLNSSPEIAPHFAKTDFERQRKLLRDSVHLMVARDVADPEMRALVNQLGEAHSRAKRNVLPRLYELWLDSICETVKALDSEWTAELEAHWRVRMRAGMQIIMAAY